MAKVVSATLNATAGATVTQDGTLVSSLLFTSTGGKNDYTLGGSTVVTGSQLCAQRVVLSGGAATLDLTSLKGPNDSVITALGLKLRGWAFQAQKDGAGAYVKCGASNGYPVDGLTTWLLPLPAVATGAPITQPIGTGQVAVTAGTGSDGHKTMDFVGNGTEYIDVFLIFGA